ncbi:AcrR family transcriptional regulator [Parvibaculum indicum]|uniref:TetR/AcrR family transcriptional regulator n=1 Tax=Parvibaculum indicum TaxID=562969 RepID=UPI00142080B1|nr:TetR/AcrR family transcriptional regulator [Parvibaculum indicum]NIJ42744.1 AcrR family transcriptional regulator [Parvibaculum indicum]
MPKKIDHELRRLDFTEAAIAVIGRQGIDNTRLIDVARAANATTGALTHYFEGKDAVLLAAFDHVAQHILRDLLTESDESLIDRAAQALPLDEEGVMYWRVWICFLSRAVADPALARINNDYHDEFRQRLARLLETEQAAGRLSRDVDRAETAEAVIAVVDGLGVHAAMQPDTWTAERLRKQLDTMLRPLLPMP